PLLFSYINYQQLRSAYSPLNLVPTLTDQTRIHLLTGVANPKPLFDYLNQHSKDIIHYEYPDHHPFSLRNIANLVDDFCNDPAIHKIIVTTEKDAMRLLDASIKELLLDLPIFYLPIQIVIEESGRQIFDQKILNYVSSTTRNR
ncbi:MAG: tetraacyldisaccharide 4'-kinase, partial [Pedobacter sp.]